LLESQNLKLDASSRDGVRRFVFNQKENCINGIIRLIRLVRVSIPSTSGGLRIWYLKTDLV
jgi:hypothetical protein